MRLVFLVGADTASTRETIESVCQLPGIQPVAVFVDTGRSTFNRRFKNLRRNVRREGWAYIPHRVLAAARGFTDSLVENAVSSPTAVRALLRKAFPDKCFSLEELGCRYRFDVHSAGNLNEAEARDLLTASNADLGIVLGTRILKAATFGIPKLGSINLHKGKVPEYRGMPPGFWELYDGATEAGVTVHFVNEGLDTGDVVASSTFPVLPTDTPASLMERLNTEGTRVMAAAVGSIRDGDVQRQPQVQTALKARTKPTRAQVGALQKKLPRWRTQSDAHALFKNLYCLAAYYSGLYWLLRTLRSGSRGAIILYHRVNDYSKDVLTVDTQTFAAQLLAISRFYHRISTRELVDSLRQNKDVPPTSVAIHFDDCYQDIYTHGAPILAAAGFPATAFINSGFIDTNRTFDHDAAKYPFQFPNLQSPQIRGWVEQGFEVGAHTVNHVNLGTHPVDEARREISDCRTVLEALTGKAVPYFSFPFGGLENIRPEVVENIQESGFAALFSAHGGFIGAKTDLYDIPRLGGSGEWRPLYMLMELEGIALGQIASKLRGWG